MSPEFDEYDEAVMGAGIHLSNFLAPFLSEGSRTHDRLADLGLLNRHQLNEVRRCQAEMVAARTARVEAARSSPVPTLERQPNE